ncbi:LysE family transporter [Paucibacter sp. O1-1]|nr:LysE family transporter [Paucibacter sp. O1-1]MDA3828509.1 LysE family transporter [Paucibacter sp. O1-1]
MLAPETLFAFVSAALLVIAVPGPAMLMVLGQLRHSRMRAVAAVAGLVVGDLLLISAAGLGLATLLRQWPLLLTVLRWAGAAYVGWMGWAVLRAAPAAVAAPAAGGFRAALLLTLINPKPVLFFAAFFPLFLGAGPQPWLLGFLGLGLLFELLNIGFYALLIAAAGLLGARLGGAGWGAGLWLQRGGGVALLLCAPLVLLA